MIKLDSSRKPQLFKFSLKEIILCVFLQLSPSKNKSPAEFWIFPSNGLLGLMKNILVGPGSFLWLISIKFLWGYSIYQSLDMTPWAERVGLKGMCILTLWNSYLWIDANCAYTVKSKQASYRKLKQYGFILNINKNKLTFPQKALGAMRFL